MRPGFLIAEKKRNDHDFCKSAGIVRKDPQVIKKRQKGKQAPGGR
jgi:hypothetical protein